MDVFLKSILVLLLFFVSFAFAGAEPWAFSVMQGGIMLSIWLLAFSRRHIVITPLFKPVLFTLGFLTLFALLQSAFPQTLLDKAAWYPSTLMRLYTLEHASLFVTYLLLCFLVSQLLQTSRELKFFAMLAALCGLAVALCALCMPDGDYIYYLAGKKGGVGPFLNRNHAGIFLGMSAVMTLGYTAISFLDYSRFAANGRKGPFCFRQIFFSLVFLGLCAGTVFTRSRGGMLALGIGIFSYAFLCAGFIAKNTKTRLKGLLLTLTALVLCSGWVMSHVDEINAFAHRVSDTSTQTRKMLYRTSLNMLKDYPLWGIGIGAMPVAITSYMPQRLNHYVERLHSDWLEILLGTGYIGFLPVLFGVLWFIKKSFSRMRRLPARKQFLFASLLSGLTVMSIGSAVDFDFFIPATAYLFFLMLGMTCSPSYDKHHIRAYMPPALLRAAAVLLCIAACIIPLQKTIAWRLHLFGSGLKAQSKIAAYQNALKHYPSPRYALYLGNAYYNQSLRAENTHDKKALRAKAHALSLQYLEKYPKEKALSRLYFLSR